MKEKFLNSLRQSGVLQRITTFISGDDEVFHSLVMSRSVDVVRSMGLQLSETGENFFRRTNLFLLISILFGTIFVPRQFWGGVGGFYRVDIRLEDILLVLLTLGMFFQIAVAPKGRIVAKNVLGMEMTVKAFLFFLCVCQLSIVVGVLTKVIDKPILSYLYLLKWVEYFAIFWLACQICDRLEMVRVMTTAFWLLGIAVALYGYVEYLFPAEQAAYPNYYRLYERYPFHGDANHIGGLLILWFGFFLAFFMREQTVKMSCILGLSLLFVYFPIIWTYSRKSYFSLLGILLFAILFKVGRKKLLGIASLMVLGGLLLPTKLFQRLVEIGATFASTDPFHSSWATNLQAWKIALWNFDHFFLFGSGLGSRHRLIYESQYLLVLSEVGVVGTLAFLLLMIAPLIAMWSAWKARSDIFKIPYMQAWIFAFVGILIHNLTCVSLTVSKVAIPFWILTAIVLSRLSLERSSS